MLFFRPDKPFPQTPAGPLFLYPVLLGDTTSCRSSSGHPPHYASRPTHCLLFPHSCPVAVGGADFLTEIMSGPEWALGQLLNEQREWDEAGGGAETGTWVLRVRVRVWYMEPDRSGRGMGAEILLRSDHQSFERHQWSLLQNPLKNPQLHSTVLCAQCHLCQPLGGPSRLSQGAAEG